MSRERYVVQIVQELGAEMGMSDLALDENGRASLLFDDTPVTLMYCPDPVELLWLLVDLGEIDVDRHEPLEALLQLGFQTWSANRMTIGLTENGNRAVGHTSIPVVNLDRGLLEETLRYVLETADAIRERLARGELEPGSPPPGDARGPGGVRA